MGGEGGGGTQFVHSRSRMTIEVGWGGVKEEGGGRDGSFGEERRRGEGQEGDCAACVLWLCVCSGE